MSKQERQELDKVIQDALKIVKAKKETDLCHYLPVEGKNSDVGGYMHHFTFRKLKNEDPKALKKEIEKNIIDSKNPKKVAPKPRLRTPRRRRDGMLFSKHDIERLLQMARMAGDKEMIRKLTTQHKDLRAVKRELIASIRHNQVEPDLWNTYVELATSQQSLEATVNVAH